MPGEIWTGDDAALVGARAGGLLVTTDMLIEGVHFDLEITSPRDLGYKSLAVNLSDIAAMGGVADRAVVGLGATPALDVDRVEELARGIADCAAEFSTNIVGGDLSRSDCLVLSLTVLGHEGTGGTILRDGAEPGDALCVTGKLGESAAGYRMLRAGMRHAYVDAHRRPTPRLKEAAVICEHGPSAMIDISDGLAIDLHRLCDASEVGAAVDEAGVPAVDLGDVDLDRSAMELAIGGGEDYELLFTVAEGSVEAVNDSVSTTTGTQVTKIGVITERSDGVTLESQHSTVPLEPKGWDHLAT